MKSRTGNAHNSGSYNGELPLLHLQSATTTTSGREQISSRAKCSSSRSLYYADGHEFEESSQRDVRSSASTLYRTFESEFDAPSSRHKTRLRSKHATSSSSLTRDALPLRVESARGRIAGWSLPIYSELPAAAGEEICPSRNKEEEEEEEAADEDDHDHDENNRNGTEQLQEEAGNYVWKNVHAIVCQSCGMEVGEFQLRRTSTGRRHAAEAFVLEKLRSSRARGRDENSAESKFVSCEMDGIGDLQSSDEKTSAPTPSCKDRERESVARLVQAAELVDEGPGLSSRELEKTAVETRDGDFARCSQMGASFQMEGVGPPPRDVDVSPSSDHPASQAWAAVPFKWEEAPGKPKTTTTTATAQKAKTRATTDQGSGDSRHESGSPVLKSTKSLGDRRAEGERSHRYYGQVAAHNRETSVGSTGASSSRGLTSQDKETHIDLVAPAAAKFLVQETSYLSPLATPVHRAFASPVAVPFKWEETPGKPKADAEASKPHSLQLPPRLAIPQQRAGIGSRSFSARDLRAHYLPNYSLSGPLVGFFSPCLASACAQARPRQHAVSNVHHSSSSSSSSSSSYKASKSLPRKLSNSSPLRSYYSSSTHGDYCQIKNPNGVLENSPTLRKRNRSAFSAPLARTSPTGSSLQPPTWYSAELKASHPCMNTVVGEAGEQESPDAGVMINSSSPTSIFHGPEAESLSQTSASNPSLSGYLDALTRPTSTPSGASLVRSKSSSSSQASYESVAQDFDQQQEQQDQQQQHASPTSYSHHRPLAVDSGNNHDSRRFRKLGLRNVTTTTQDDDEETKNHAHRNPRGCSASSAGMKAFIKLCRNGNCFGMPNSSSNDNSGDALHSSQLRRATLATYFHNCMELNHNSTLSGELDERGSSSWCTAAAAAAAAIPSLQAATSPVPLTRLPYTMPSVAEQELTARDLHKPSPPNPDFAARLGASITKLTPRQASNATTMSASPSEKQISRTHTNYSKDEEVSASPAYATALEMLSPGVNFTLKQKKRCTTTIASASSTSSSSSSSARNKFMSSSRWTGPKVRHRVRFIFSMCKALKRVLFKQRHRKVVVEPKLWYYDDTPLTEFQFVKPTEY